MELFLGETMRCLCGHTSAITCVKSAKKSPLKLKYFYQASVAYLHKLQVNVRTSNSTPAKHSHPRCSAFSMTLFRTPRGQTLIGAFVSGSKNETKKNGILLSKGIMRNVDRSMLAVRSRYPLAELEIRSSFEYTVSCMSQPLLPLMNARCLLTRKDDIQNNTAESEAIRRGCAQKLFP